ncbi:hypothetical protein ACFV3R_08900 [Streptomyces sp. NPDC059740]|uniref:hypothetical protein n=1 Tax=Streptomyces sp. NPDC059740 TaxID=3346926 RepID=UPI00364DF06D
MVDYEGRRPVCCECGRADPTARDLGLAGGRAPVCDACFADLVAMRTLSARLPLHRVAEAEPGSEGGAAEAGASA